MEQKKLFRESTGPAENRYSHLQADREYYLNIARDCAKLTIPSLIRSTSSLTNRTTEKLQTPWQGLGSRGVNNLASKLLLVLLPPNSPFFEFRPDSLVIDQADQKDDGENIKTEIEKRLSQLSRGVMEDIENSGDRTAIGEMIKHLLVAGNVLLHDHEDGLRLYHLDRYVVVRDASGNPIEMIAVDVVSPASLDEDLRETLERAPGYIVTEKDNNHERSLKIFTHLQRQGDQWEVYQECCGIELPDSRGTYPIDKSPWIPLRLHRVDGEDYGRSYVEEYLGDLRSLENLMQAVIEGAMAAARVIPMVRSNASTSLKRLNDAENGEFVHGNPDDVGILQMDKYYDFRTAKEIIMELQQRLSYAFLMNTAIQRQAERVTAEEIRYAARELEDALGGVYAVLAEEFQKPYLNARMNKLRKAGKLPEFPKDTVRISIVTGMEALGLTVSSRLWLKQSVLRRLCESWSPPKPPPAWPLLRGLILKA
jgi:hypothetical protein